MAHTLGEYLEQTSANDADLLRRLTVYSAVARKSSLMVQYVAASRCEELEVFTHLIHRSADLGFNMAGEAVSRMPREVKDRHPNLPWPAFRELRDLLTHRSEKQLGNREKAFNRIAALQVRIAQTPNLLAEIDNALRTEPDGAMKEEIRSVRRGIRYAIAMTALSANADVKTLISPNDPKTCAAADLMECQPKNLLALIAMGAGRSALVEISDYLSSSSLFIESLDDVANTIPKNLRALRNDLAHFNQERRTPTGYPSKDDNLRVLRALDSADKMGEAIKRTLPNDEQLFYSAPAIAERYRASLVRRLKPEALAYLDTVVEKATAMQPSNPRLEQAIIIASSKLLRDRPIEQAREIIEFVTSQPVSPMNRDANGKLDALDAYRDQCPAPLQSTMRRYVEEIQQRCTRSHSNSIV